jgi:hypothetical protein
VYRFEAAKLAADFFELSYVRKLREKMNRG